MRLSALTAAACAALLVAGCSTRPMTEEDKRLALADFRACEEAARAWLEDLDASDYASMAEMSDLGPYRGRARGRLEAAAADFRKAYGRVEGRSFLGANLWSGEKLLSYAPGLDEPSLARIGLKRAEDGFYQVEPRRFGFWSSLRVYLRYPKERYVMMLYTSRPTLKDYAEERQTLMRDAAGTWRVVDYRIADDV